VLWSIEIVVVFLDDWAFCELVFVVYCCDDFCRFRNWLIVIFVWFWLKNCCYWLFTNAGF